MNHIKILKDKIEKLKQKNANLEQVITAQNEIINELQQTIEQLKGNK